jgi:hypothetical protein
MRLHVLPECILDRNAIVNAAGWKGKEQVGAFHLTLRQRGREIDFGCPRSGQSERLETRPPKEKSGGKDAVA